LGTTVGGQSVHRGVVLVSPDLLRDGAELWLFVTGRVTDASVIVQAPPRPNRLGTHRTTTRAAVGVPRNGIECGAQETGGNYAFFTRIAPRP